MNSNHYESLLRSKQAEKTANLTSSIFLLFFFCFLACYIVVLFYGVASIPETVAAFIDSFNRAYLESKGISGY